MATFVKINDEGIELFRCGKCREVKQKDDFYKSRLKYGIRWECKKCTKSNKKEGYQKHKKEKKEYNAKYRQEYYQKHKKEKKELTSVNYLGKGKPILRTKLSSGEKAAQTRFENKQNGIITLKYKHETFYNNPEKNKIRNEIINILKENYAQQKSKTDYAMLCLESPELEFIDALHENDIFKDNAFITIPNNIEYDKLIKNSNKRKYLSSFLDHDKENKTDNMLFYRNKEILSITLFSIVNQSYYMYALRKHAIKDGYYNFIWADYCGTFTSYKDDIKLTFARKLLKDNSIFAVTFCSRDSAKTGKNALIIDMLNFITNTANYYGYKIEYLFAENYNTTMVTLIMKVYQDKYITSNEITTLAEILSKVLKHNEAEK